MVQVVATSGGETAQAAVDVVVLAGSLASVAIEPQEVTLDIGQSQEFTASALDAFGNAITDALMIWSAPPDAGTIDRTGSFTTGTRAGTYQVELDVVRDSEAASAATSVTVLHDPLAGLAVQPREIVVEPGVSQIFTIPRQEPNRARDPDP